MILKNLLTKFQYEVLEGTDQCEINKLKYDSRLVEEGDVFVCIKGAGFDSHKFIDDVIEKKAAAIIVSDNVTNKGVTIIKVKDTRYALACMSADYFGNPASKITTIGITGTKGKTTTSYMVKSVLDSVGIKTGLIGTVETIIGDEKIPANNTTPESYILQETFKRMVDEGCECVVMEVSSQGLKLNRVAGFVFDYGIFTNIEPDHISPTEHKDFEEYLQCKSMLLKQCKHGIVNKDADHIKEIIKGHTCDLETFGISKGCDFKAENINLFKKPGVLCVSYELTGKLNFPVEIHMPGMFNVYNSLCAIAICSYFTKDTNIIAKALKDASVKGRVEIIPISPKFTLMIDYAHNAMSLESLLTSLKEYSPKRLVTVFGCGGNRAKGRRFEMGEVSSRLSDFTIVTSDNPRFEEPIDIINDILVGVNKHKSEYVTIPDRKDAIRYSIVNAHEGDVIILAGKGHEDYQEIKGVKHAMDERVLIKELLEEDEVIKALN